MTGGVKTTGSSTLIGRPEERPRDPLMVAGLVVTLLLHVGVFGGLWLSRARAGSRPSMGPGLFVDAQLVRFGKPRDLSFLPHKQGAVKKVGPPQAIKIARDATAPINLKKEDKPPDVVDPLKKTHAEVFKQLQDDDNTAVEDQTGSQTGSRAGTAAEAKGDPYILDLIDKIGSQWQVPTTIKDAELAGLSADVCLTIDGSGALTRYEFTRKSGNSQFDSSLDATLGSLHTLPVPPERFARAAARGRLCPTFSKQ